MIPLRAAPTLLAALFWLVYAGAGIAAAEDEPEAAPMAGVIPLPRPRPQLWVEPHTFREAAGPDFKSDEVTSEPSECRKRLDLVAAISPMPRLIGPGACGGDDMVQLDAVLIPGKARVAVKPAPVIRCTMAEQLALWIRDEAAPRVAAAGPALRSVETYDDFDCRGRNRVVGAKMSEHGKGNAVDVRSFTTVDGRAMQLTDINASKELRDTLRQTACARFSTVLGPGSDGHHEEHIHLDLAERRGNYRICQWDVREPLPPTVLVAYVQIAGKTLPLPPHRPATAGEPAKDGPKL
jgi:hypothetical protein